MRLARLNGLSKRKIVAQSDSVGNAQATIQSREVFI
jgi:hypothetical protein